LHFVASIFEAHRNLFIAQTKLSHQTWKLEESTKRTRSTVDSSHFLILNDRTTHLNLYMATTSIPSRPPPPRGAPSGAPANQSLYVSNLPDKLQKADLRRSLYLLFSTYGPVLDIVTLKTMKMRGQAHIVYRDVHCAAQALRSLDGFEFFGKEIKIQYAKSKSNTIAKLDGTFKIPTPATSTQATELQQSIFNAPPSASTTSAPPAKGQEKKEDLKGVKRPRDEEEEDAGDESMEEDDGSAMEESDDD